MLLSDICFDFHNNNNTDPVAADVSGTQMYYGVEGGSVTLVAHVNITGNPVPGSVWMFNGATARGDTVVSGQLTITNLASADSGNYTNTLNNTLNNGSTPSISNSVLLHVLCKHLITMVTNNLL